MKKFKPFRDNVLVEKVNMGKSLILADNTRVGKWVKLRVIAVGPDVKEVIKPGMIVWAENMVESVDISGSESGLILSKYIHAQEVEDATGN